MSLSKAAGLSIEDRATRLLAGDRAALARAITLVESTREDHRREAEALIERVLPASGKARGDTRDTSVVELIRTPAAS